MYPKSSDFEKRLIERQVFADGEERIVLSCGHVIIAAAGAVPREITVRMCQECADQYLRGTYGGSGELG